MISRAFNAQLLVHAAPLQAQTAQPLEVAERALVNALMLPDRDAFRQLLATDAVALVPAVAYGPDAIVEKWRPFLSSPEVRLAPIIETSVMAESGEQAETSGSFTVYGRTRNGMGTTPAGTFSIVWRLVNGQWKIVRLTSAGRKAD